jgi:LPXTG-motif cell wall-anchored protein
MAVTVIEMRRNWSRRLAICAAGLAACLAVLSAFSATALAASTVHGSATDLNTCTGTFDPPGQPPPPPPSTLGITISSDASPEPPHELDPVTLSNTTLKVSVPASFLQLAIDAGIFDDGKTFPATVALVIAGSNTVEATHAFEENTTVTLHVVDGAVQLLTATVQLQDTIWHPASVGPDISFTEKSVQVVVVIDRELLSPVVLTLECAPSEDRAFVALGSACPVVALCGGTESTTTAPPESTVFRQAPDPILPRTGSSSGYAVFVALSCIAGGALLLIRRRRDLIR